MSSAKVIRMREMVIDRLLQSRKGATLTELMEQVNNKLRSENETTVSSRNTILADLVNIGNQWKRVINRIRQGRTIRYCYHDSSFSAFKGQLTYNELFHIHGILASLIERRGNRIDVETLELEKHLRLILRLPISM